MIQRFTRLGGLALAALVLAGPVFARAQAQTQEEPRRGSMKDAIRGGKRTPATTPAPAPAPTTTQTGSSTAQGAAPDAALAATQNAFFATLSVRNASAMELGKLAEQRGSSAEVKQLGQRLGSEHQKLEDDLKKLVASRGVDFAALGKAEDPAHKQLVQRLQGLSGAEFDREFVMAVRDVQAKLVDELKDFRDRTPGKDPTLKEWLDATENGAENRLTATRQVKQALDSQRAAQK